MRLRDRKLTEDIANSIYDVLMEVGASEFNLDSFVYHYTKPDEKYGPSHEWRFCGKYGMAGKFWWNDDRFYISGHSHSEVSANMLKAERAEIEAIDAKLAVIKAKHDEVPI